MTILALCALLVVGAAVFAATFMSKPAKPKAGACANPSASARPAQSRFSVNVYNGGGPKGAAGDAAEALRSHDFSVGAVNNDPYRKKITNAGEIRFGPQGAENAKKYVAPQVPGATLVQDGRDGTSVDVVVGPEFPTLSTASADATPSLKC